ncbi:MAG TPA: hypothetical protein VFG45_00060 [Candidatus Nitrosocosmicus sp.]|nr:hypothetical protein [Candidatus Nitrosocosmicus sp.]
MKTLLIYGLLVFVLFFYLKPIEAVAIPADQVAVLIKSWAIPMTSNQNSSFALTSSFSGNEIYYVDSDSNKIGRLVPETNTITEWDIPTANSFPISIAYHPSGNVYFIEDNSNKIGRLVPETNTITEWTIQSNSTNIKSMALGFAGNEEIYYVDSDSNKIGRIAPATNLVTEWDIPTANSFPISVKFDRATGNVYFLESNSNTIGRLGPFSSQITEWKLPEKPFDIEVDSAGSIHYIDVKGTKIVRMD